VLLPQRFALRQNPTGGFNGVTTVKVLLPQRCYFTQVLLYNFDLLIPLSGVGMDRQWLDCLQFAAATKN
jgi:hypothetical protein